MKPAHLSWGRAKGKTGTTSLGSVSANPALPSFFLMRHFTTLMRKFPGGIEAPGWELGIRWNLCTVRWRQAHRKGSTGGEMEGNQVDLLYCTDLNVCSVSASISPLLPPREQAKPIHRPVVFVYKSLLFSSPGPTEFFHFCFPKHQSNTTNPTE